MSWQFTVPAGPLEDFKEAAKKAKDVYEQQLAGADYGMAQLSSGQADQAIKAAAAVVASGVLGKEGVVSATLGGHHNPADGLSSVTQSVAINVQCTPSAAPTPAVTPPAPSSH